MHLRAHAQQCMAFGSTSEAFGCFPLGVHSPAGPPAGEDPMQGEQHRAREQAAALPGAQPWLAAPGDVSPLQPRWTVGNSQLCTFIFTFKEAAL